MAGKMKSRIVPKIVGKESKIINLGSAKDGDLISGLIRKNIQFTNAIY